MSKRTEREEIARIIQEARDRPDIMAIHIADIVLREHIEPLRVRASALEALLAECETVLTALVALKDDKDRYGKDANYIRQMPQAWEAGRLLLAKIKARTETRL